MRNLRLLVWHSTVFRRSEALTIEEASAARGMHDYPRSEDFFLAMVGQVTGVQHQRGSLSRSSKLDSKDIFKYPFLYFSEPGFMDLTDEEEKNLREYFNRGGFAMFDDFRGEARSEPRGTDAPRLSGSGDWFGLNIKDPIFHSFYDIDNPRHGSSLS